MVAPARVLFVNDTARNGGPPRSLVTLLRNLDPVKVHRAVVLPSRGLVSDELEAARAVDELIFEPGLIENPVAPLFRVMERADFDAPAPLRALRLVGNGCRAAFGLATLVGRAAADGYELLYANGTTACFVTALAGGLARVPVLWHVRYLEVPAGVAALHDRLASSDAVRRIVCVSHAAAARFAEVDAKVRVVHNAVHLDDFHVAPVLREALGLPADAVVFGMHGRILRKKGLVELLRATRLLLDRRPDARLRLVVVGDTPGDFRPDHLEECRALAGSLGLSDRVSLVGFRRDVAAWVAGFDVAVVPSVAPDALPRAVIEAMAAGKPVIGSAVGGIAEMIEDGISGALVPPGDVTALADAMGRLLADPARRGRQGAAARALVELRFDARAHARAIEREILATRRCRDGSTPS